MWSTVDIIGLFFFFFALSSDHISCFCTAVTKKKGWPFVVPDDYSDSHSQHFPDSTKKECFILTFGVFSCGLLSKPLQHMSFVFCHPFDVGLGLLYSLLQGQGGWAKTKMEVVFFKFLQLKSDRKKQRKKKLNFCIFSSSLFSLRKIQYVFQCGCGAAYLMQLILCRESLCDSIDKIREGKWSFSIPKEKKRKVLFIWRSAIMMVISRRKLCISCYWPHWTRLEKISD